MPICCPWCGEREQTEFSYHGEAHIVRPPRPAELSDEQWADYVFFRKNPKGVHYERWMHAFGCRRYFNMARNTATGQIYGSYKMGEAPPAAAVAAAKNEQAQANKATGDAAGDAAQAGATA